MLDLEAIKDKWTVFNREREDRNLMTACALKDVPALVAEVEGDRRVIEELTRDKYAALVEVDKRDAEINRLREENECKRRCLNQYALLEELPPNPKQKAEVERLRKWITESGDHPAFCDYFDPDKQDKLVCSCGLHELLKE